MPLRAVCCVAILANSQLLAANCALHPIPQSHWRGAVKIVNRFLNRRSIQGANSTLGLVGVRSLAISGDSVYLRHLPWCVSPRRFAFYRCGSGQHLLLRKPCL